MAMNNSTDGVTLFAGFAFDVLAEYQSMRDGLCAPVFKRVAHLKPERPTDLMPMQLFNEICDWVEQNIGESSLRNAGRAIGDRAFNRMLEDGSIGAKPGPAEILQALQKVATVMIQDPKNRGWEILSNAPNKMVMRRTQSFNCVLQEGLIRAMIERTGVMLPRTEQVHCTRRGDPFCDYEVRWS